MSVGNEMPDGFTDIICTRTEIHFSWGDRIRLLLSGVCWLNIETFTENPPGNVQSKSAVMAVRRSAYEHRIRRGVHLSLSRRDANGNFGDAGNYASP